jgi:hypothetical protein
MIIGLVGFIGSGKGSVADLLVERHGYNKESFAGSVKDAVSTIFGWDRSLLEGDTIKSRAWREEPDAWWSKRMGKEFSPRLALQLMGTEAGRDIFHTDLWIYSVERRINPDKNYVIADVRFPNEIKMIQDLGGKIVRVTRGQKPEWYDTALETNSKQDYYGMAAKYPEVHYSEWAWIGCDNDTTISNNGSLEDLIIVVDSLVKNVYNNVHVEANEVVNYEIV